jgi:hypothetical protein
MIEVFENTERVYVGRCKEIDRCATVLLGAWAVKLFWPSRGAEALSIKVYLLMYPTPCFLTVGGSLHKAAGTSRRCAQEITTIRKATIQMRSLCTSAYTIYSILTTDISEPQPWQTREEAFQPPI